MINYKTVNNSSHNPLENFGYNIILLPYNNNNNNTMIDHSI